MICSANGFGNLGDDAVTQALADVVREVEPAAEITITSPPPQRKYVEEADVVLVGGGGLFYDSDFANAVNYTQYLLWADEQNKPACAVGIGTQGIRTAHGGRLFREAVHRCRAVTVRDEYDRDVLTRIGIRRPVRVTRDLAFLLRKERYQLPSRRRRPRLAFSLREVPAIPVYEKYRRTTSECIARLQGEFDVYLVLQSYDDLPLYTWLSETYGCPVIELAGAPARALSVYEEADLVLTSRYHGLIFAVLMGTPVIVTGTKEGKGERLISFALPSLRPAFIAASEFTMEALEQRLRDFRAGLIEPADPTEVRACVASAQENVQLVREAIAAT